MTDSSHVNLTPSGPPETVLPPLDPAVADGLRSASAMEGAARRDALARVVAGSPRTVDGWAALAMTTDPVIERYAYARVGYHRGLDALRSNGWRGSGYVRWSEPSNRGFLRCLESLRAAAATIGEDDEADRCATFLRQLDPSWPPTELGGDQAG
jgi:hypothetical protein